MSNPPHVRPVEPASLAPFDQSSQRPSFGPKTDRGSPEEFLESYKSRKELRQSVPDRVDLNKNLSLEEEDLRKQYLRGAYHPYGNATSKSAAQSTSYLRSNDSASSPKLKSTVATSVVGTNQYL